MYIYMYDVNNYGLTTYIMCELFMYTFNNLIVLHMVIRYMVHKSINRSLCMVYLHVTYFLYSHHPCCMQNPLKPVN